MAMIRKPNPIVVASVSSGWEFFKETSTKLLCLFVLAVVVLRCTAASRCHFVNNGDC